MSGEIAYATLAQVRTEVKANATTSDSILLQMARWATAAIDNHRGATYAPQLRSVYLDPRHATDWGARNRLWLDGVAMAIVEVTDTDGTVLVDGTDFVSWPRGETPIQQLVRAGGDIWELGSDPELNQVVVEAYWGYHADYSAAWRQLTLVNEAANVTSSQTTIVVDSASAISPGMLLKIDDELMVVESIATNTLTVTRGVRGTTAAAHSDNDVVYSFQPEPAVVRACARLAGYMHQRMGAFESTTFDGVATVTMPPAIPADALFLLNDLPRAAMPRIV